MQQSIGQQSIIGLNQASRVTMLQGFIQPPLLFSKSKKVDPLLLQATVTPNPFSQSTTIIFSEAINDCIYVNLYDLYGRALYSNKFGSSQEINIDFGNLFSGLYIIKIQSGKKRLVSKLIKE